MIRNQSIDYFNNLEILISKLEFQFDCVVAVKRSGWIMGVIISNRFDKPLYTTSEIDLIPLKFKKVILVDDKTCSGKTFRKYSKKLEILGKEVKTASLYIEDDFFSDFWVEFNNNKTEYMWYESKK